MIVAVGIFGLIGLLAGQLLTQSIQVTEKVLFRGERLNEIQRAIQIVEWDIRQLTHRQIRNEYGEIMPALVNSGGASIEFTRRGFINATGEQRSNLQRVQYYVQEGNLMRAILDKFGSCARHSLCRSDVVEASLQYQVQCD